MLIVRWMAKITCKAARILSRFDCWAWSNHEPTGLDREALEAKERRPNIGNTARYCIVRHRWNANCIFKSEISTRER